MNPNLLTEKLPSQTLKVKWLPDETFFSLCSRQHILTCNVLPGTTSIQLLNLTKKRIKHDFPCGLDAFEINTAGYWGGADTIIQNHTILPFFAHFSSEEKVNAAVSILKGAHIGSLKYRLGLITGGFGAEHPLKGCPECVKSDLARYGVAYWHLIHQYPGLVACPTHWVWLRESLVNRQWVDRFAWSLPKEDNFLPPPEGSPPEQSALRSITHAIGDLAALEFTYIFDPMRVSKAYRQELPSDSSASLLSYLEPLRGLYPFNSLPATEEEAACFIKCLTRTPRGQYHPLKHLLVATWLFKDFQSFMECYEGTGVHALLNVSMLERPTISQEVAAKTSSRESTAKLRPKTLKPAVRASLLTRLAAGEPKSKVCAEFEITVSTVNKLLRAEPAIHALWLNFQRDRELSEHRNYWLRLRSAFPKACVKTLRSQAASVYAWLYRNDRAWLIYQSTHTPKSQRANRAFVDWDERDSRLEALVRKSLIARYGTDHDLSLSRAQLYALAPDIPRCIENRSRYPGTRAYLETLGMLVRKM